MTAVIPTHTGPRELPHGRRKYIEERCRCEIRADRRTVYRLLEAS